MGRYSWPSKSTVEEYKSISVYWLKKQGCFKKALSSGEIKWANNCGEDLGGVRFYTTIYENHGYLTLEYVFTNVSSGEREDLQYSIDLTSTHCYYGGKRWWFICPTNKNGASCGRRVGKLYIGDQGKYFACRYCYDLTYISCQESHRFDRMYAQIAMESGFTPAMVKMTLKEKFKRNP